ncbi:MAG: molybdenum cofactor carrier [Rhodothermales bacterium]|nr:molybdenum cofactor carrier [Rhodothermales bacterium]
MDQPKIDRIRSGGQTGVDRAALDAAIAAGVRHEGWCPSGRRAEDGRIPGRYHLNETDSSDYAERTRLNVRDADGTLIVSAPSMQGGTRLTFQIAVGLWKPVFLVSPGKTLPDRQFGAWLLANRIRHLNVAGPRASSSPAVYRDALRLMTDVLKRFGRPSF